MKPLGLCLCAKFPFDTDRSGIYTAFMEKQEIKKRLLEAVKEDEHFADIKSVAIFGSYVNGQASEDSDIDVLIDFVPSARIGLFEFVGIKHNFESALRKQVDLLTPDSISKFFRDEVLKQAESIYEK